MELTLPNICKIQELAIQRAEKMFVNEETSCISADCVKFYNDHVDVIFADCGKAFPNYYSVEVKNEILLLNDDEFYNYLKLNKHET